MTVDPTPPIRPIPPKQPDTPTQISRPQTNVLPPVDDTQSQRDEPPQAQVDNSDQNNARSAAGDDPRDAHDRRLVAPGTRDRLGPVPRRHRREMAQAHPAAHGAHRPSTGSAAAGASSRTPRSTTATIRRRRRRAANSPAPSAAHGRPRWRRWPTAPSSVPSRRRPHEADTVWRAVDDLRGRSAKRQTRWRRFVALISLRSLGVSREAERFGGPTELSGMRQRTARGRAVLRGVRKLRDGDAGAAPGGRRLPAVGHDASSNRCRSRRCVGRFPAADAGEAERGLSELHGDGLPPLVRLTPCSVRGACRTPRPAGGRHTFTLSFSTGETVEGARRRPGRPSPDRAAR